VGERRRTPANATVTNMGQTWDKTLRLSHGFPYFIEFLGERRSNDFGTKSTSVHLASLILLKIWPHEIEQTPKVCF
jgi:hypothetical protein